MTKDLTQGSELKGLVIFSLPIMIGNFLQQMYNIVDTLIVGKVLGASALAAVGSSYTLMVLLTSIILGLCMGSGVVFAQLFGAKQYKNLKISIFNSFVFTAMVTVIINVTAFLLLSSMIKWLNIPVQAVLYTKDYLKMIFVGIGFTFIYNFFASVLRSIGNTVTPLIFLGVSAVLNIVLDIVFMVPFGMGVTGAAVATVISQGVSAVMITLYFVKKCHSICPNKEDMKIDKCLLKKVMSSSVLTSIQQSIMNFGILMIQGLVNSFGVAAMAAFTAVVKIDGFAYMPVQDFGNAFATFIAQNFGAKKQGRIINGTKKAFMLSAVFCFIMSVFVCVFAKPLMLLFIDKTEIDVINIGVEYLRIEGVFYVGIGVLFLLYGYYRGVGNSLMSIVLTVLSLGSRVVLAYTLSAIDGVGLKGVWWAIPIGWVIADIVGVCLMCRRNTTGKQQI